MKTQVATGEGIVFGLWDGVKGDAEGFVDMFRTLGQVFSSPWKTASELYHTFKTLKDLTSDQVKDKVQELFDSFLINQQERMEWVLEGESSDAVYLGAYMGGYLGGYIGEQVLVTIGTAGLSKGKYIARAISEGKQLLNQGLNLTQKIPRNFNQVFSRYVRTADEGRSVSTVANRCTSGNCFAPGTLVLMANGNNKVIEEVERGEWIVTDDPNDNEPPKPAKVEWLIRNRTDRLFTVEWDRDGDGRTDAQVRATSEHPFYTLGRGWTPTKDLQPGDRIQTHQQRTVTITGNHAWIAPSVTYNLDVGEPHTYFVGNSESWLLVHNAEFAPVPFRPTNPPNQNHHGLMNIWLKHHFPTTYLGRELHDDFPCIELSEANHNETRKIETRFRVAKGLPPYGSTTWKDVTPQEIIKVGREALRAANVPDADKVFDRLLNQTNGWLRNNWHKWRCP
jgi:Pretoxin HINT domain/HNH/Endo VII superfamily toxin with a SHH signature